MSSAFIQISKKQVVKLQTMHALVKFQSIIHVYTISNRTKHHMFLILDLHFILVTHEVSKLRE